MTSDKAARGKSYFCCVQEVRRKGGNLTAPDRTTTG